MSDFQAGFVFKCTCYLFRLCWSNAVKNIPKCHEDLDERHLHISGNKRKPETYVIIFLRISSIGTSQSFVCSWLLANY